MSLKFDTHELTDLMRNFYILTGIRIVLFDENYNEIFSYPENCPYFCACLRKNPDFYKLCCESDKLSFETCKKTGTLTMYKCHAGLMEATSPIVNKGSIIGYIMFGHVSDDKDKEQFRANLLELAKKYGCTEDLSSAVKKIKFKTQKQLIAASKILEACTSYILLKDIIKPNRSVLFFEIDEYISNHLNESISVPFLCKAFNISRTRLYELCRQYIPGGIAAYVKQKRLEKAKELLLTTKLSVSEIASLTGFSDYNYFIKSFKIHFNASTKDIRRSTAKK